MGAGHAHALHVPGDSPVHRAAPHVKIVGTLVFVLAVALTPRSTPWVYAIPAVVLAGVVRAAHLPARSVLARMTVVAPFLLFALLVPFVSTGERIDVLGVGISREGLQAAVNIVAKSLLGVGASIVLAGTTPVPRILSGLDRLRTPPVLTAIAGFMLRYLEVLAGELRRMHTSMIARGHDPRWLWQARPVAAASGALFARSYERGERVHRAMLARGYTGTMPVLHEDTATATDWALALAPGAIAAAGALAGWAVVA